MSEILKTFFVCTWKNLDGDAHAGRSPRVARGSPALPLGRGRAEVNLQLLVLTPDARLLHMVAGSIDAVDLKWELAQALVTYEAIQAKPKQARKIVAWRQDRIQDQFLGKEPRKAGSPFRLQPPPRKAKTGWRKTARAQRRKVARQRAVVKRNPLAPEHKLKTGLVGGEGRAFGSNQELRLPQDLVLPTSLRLPGQPTRPYPWSDMPRDLRVRFAKAVGHTLPADRTVKPKPTQPRPPTSGRAAPK